jgi:hypothetical protein
MISSPCADCQKKNQPKEICAEDCKILHALQTFHISIEDAIISPAIDYADEGRFRLNSKDIIC